ncbi:MAG: hypothetical protein WEE89_04375 [Gemmatimonadota bacterium]
MSAETKDKEKKRTPKSRVEHPSANGAKRSTKRIELANEVATELEALRSALEEMTEHYRLRVAAQIGELMQTVRGDEAAGAKPNLPPARILQPMLEQLREARLKPRKGRSKDFGRLEELLDELVDLTPPEA